jgi:hypothetical protein
MIRQSCNLLHLANVQMLYPSASVFFSVPLDALASPWQLQRVCVFSVPLDALASPWQLQHAQK